MDVMDPNTTILAITNSTPIVHLLDNTALTLSGISSCLSILGAIVIFMSYTVEVKNARVRQTRRLLMYLTVADVMTACGILVGTVRYAIIHNRQLYITVDSHEHLCRHPSEICVAQSMVTTFSGMASFFWTLVIGIHLIYSICPFRSYSANDPERPWHELKAHILCWGVPGVITMAALSNGVLGENFSVGTGPWCWIKVCLKDSWQIVWMAVAGKAWDIITYLISMVFFVLLVFFVKRKGYSRSDLPRRTHQRLRKEDANFVYLWLLTYVLKIWGTVRFSIMLFENISYVNTLPDFEENVDTFLLYMQSFFDGLQGFCNCILFVVLDKTMRKGIVEYYKCRTQGRVAPLLPSSTLPAYGATDRSSINNVRT